MLANPSTKYVPFKPFERDFAERTWPSQRITHPPIWMSTDLRDGNQSLIEPMSIERKLQFFELLIKIGLKEIEVGFPSASQTDFDFVRKLVDENRIPDDVTIIALTQARPELIERTVESAAGAKKAMIHLYNACAPAFRKIVFNMSKQEVMAVAVEGTRHVMACMQKHPQTDWFYEYSPEVFSTTEPELALDVCNAVTAVWQPTPEKKIVFNLPATIEATTPNMYADQIEFMHNKLDKRDSVVISVHPHNDRGTAVAAAELALMAGADRVEGCLFGNGERTGNVDLVTLALNLYTQGIHPGLDFSDIDEVRRCVEHCNQLPVHPRHPYVGDLVFTAFSGSHQDAIKKSWEKQVPGQPWDVLYIPIDPADVGRNYKAIIRINSQSGKGGVAYVLEQEFGYQLPKLMHREIGKVVNDLADAKGTELTPEEIHEAFQREYLDRAHPLAIGEFRTIERGSQVTCQADLAVSGRPLVITGVGNGPIDAFVRAVHDAGLGDFELLNYSEHSLGRGAEARAISYVQLKKRQGDATFFGAGADTNIELASIKAIVSALNRLLA